MQNIGGPLSREESERKFQALLTDKIPGSYYAWSIRYQQNIVGCFELGRNNHYEHLEGDFELRGFLLPEAWGKQLAAESTRAIVEFAFNELDLPRVRAVVDFQNFRSGVVLHRLGFKPNVAIKNNVVLWLWTLDRSLKKFVPG